MPTKIHTLTITPMGILVVFQDNLWQFRVLSSDGATYGHTNHYYTAEAANDAISGTTGQR
jgi:hypothetical protein